MKHLLKMSDLTPAEVAHILDVADELKARQKAGGTEPLLKGKSVALMFSKNSTRTRTSFEVGVYQLGGLGNYMNAATELQSGRGEPLKDTARVLGRYYDCVVWRTYRQRDLEEFAEYAGVPVINGLTDYAHPCQVLADLMTIRERRGPLAGQKLCFVGDGSNMANSLIVGGLLAGMKVDCVCPHGYRPAADVLVFAHRYGSAFRLLEDPAEGVRDADAVVTAIWNTAAPGTTESESRLRDFAGFQLTSTLLKAAKPDCMVLHGLPAHRGEEISTAVFEAHADEIFTEAENRLHVQKAVLAVLLLRFHAEVSFFRLSSYGILHALDVGPDLFRCGGAVLFQQLDDGRANDGTIGDACHLRGLLRGGDAEADGAGRLGVFPHHLHDGGKVGLDLTAGAGDAEAGHDIQKSLRLFGDHGDAVLGGGRDHGDEVHAVPAAEGGKLIFFLVRQVGQDHAVDADRRAGGEKALGPVGEHDIGVGHEHHRDGHIPAHLPDQIKDFVRGGARLQGAEVGPLNDRSLGSRVGEGDAQLDEVGSICGHRADGSSGGPQIGVAAGDERNERLAVGKGLCNVTHGDPPLCSGQWRRSPCRRGRKW